MVTLNQIRIALKDNDWAGLRALHAKASIDGIEACTDARKLSTIRLQMIECAVFKGTSPGHTRTIDAMLDAIERGNHPYDDGEAQSSMLADAAIAQAQLDAMIKK